MPDMRPTIGKGSKGQYVKELQTDLLKLGYDIGASGADSIYGTQTLRAVKEFQKANSLTVDGICGTATWGAIDKAISQLDGNPNIKTYTVHIPNLTDEQANNLIRNYAGAWKTES